MKVKLCITALLALTASMYASAYDLEVDGIYYDVDTVNMTASVTYKTTDYNSYSGDVGITTSLTYNTVELQVTSIGNCAFYGCGSLTSVRFEDGTTYCECNKFGYTLTYATYCPFYKAPIKELYLGRLVGGLRYWETDSLEVLTIGSLVTSFSTSTDYYGKNLREMNSMIEDQTQLLPQFSSVVYENATLYVPTGTKEAYSQATSWERFLNIQEKEELGTGTGHMAADAAGAVEAGRYAIQGRRIGSGRCGLNIVRMSDGTTRKVVVK